MEPGPAPRTHPDDVNLFEFGPVTFPAYDGRDRFGMRSLTDDRSSTMPDAALPLTDRIGDRRPKILPEMGDGPPQDPSAEADDVARAHQQARRQWLAEHTSTPERDTQ
jgi:hypothetical protein